MKKIRYFGLDQYVDMRELLFELGGKIEASNISVTWDYFTKLMKISWDEELIDLENK